jgi:hypothetical protein
MQKCAKKNYSFHFIGISIDEYNISPTEKLYIIPLVIFFITDRRTISNSIDDFFYVYRYSL